MESYEVTGESLLSELVTALVRQLRPVAIVRRSPERWSGESVRVRAEKGQRWVAVTHPGIESAELAGLFQQGAVGVVELGASSEDFSRALNALDGTHPPHVSVSALRMLTSAADMPNSSPVRLTPREEEIAELAERGHSNKEIAAALGIAAGTVRTHLHSLSVKLDVQSRTRMVAKARKLGLLPSRESVRSVERNSA